MQRPPLPYLLLLPLLAVLLFGNCGLTSTRQVLREMPPATRDALRASVAQRQAARKAARQRLRGTAKRDAYQQIEQLANHQADSILLHNRGSVERKFRNRRNKLERQLLRFPPPPMQP